MPAETADKKAVSVWMEVRTVERLKKILKKADIPRNVLLSNTLWMATKELEAYEKFYAMAVGLVLRNTLEKFGVYKLKMGKEGGQTVSIWVDKELVERIDRLADRAGMTRSKLIRNMIEVSLEELELIGKFGMLHHSQIIKKARKKLSDDFREALVKEGIELQ